MSIDAELQPRSDFKRDALIALVLLLAVVAWELSGLDLRVMRLFGRADGFPWRHQVLTASVLYEGGRVLGWAVLLGWLLWTLWPRRERAVRNHHLAWWLVAVCAAWGITLIKRFSLTSCPWELAEFGGMAYPVPHWWLGVPDGGPGHCFPSGHASSAFALLALFMALRERQPQAARAVLAAVLLAGVVSGAVQVVRGAHYPSHVFWTAWFCWALCCVCGCVFGALARRFTPAGSRP